MKYHNGTMSPNQIKVHLAGSRLMKVRSVKSAGRCGRSRISRGMTMPAKTASRMNGFMAIANSQESII